MYNIDSKKKGRSFMNKVLNVLELFAGVGGFRIGLENASNSVFNTKWSNQWEPSRIWMQI